MSIIEHIVQVFAPHVCLGCGLEENRLVCEACVHTLIPVPSRCYRCGIPTEGYATCDRCVKAAPLEHVVVAAEYKTLARKLLHQVKYERARSGTYEMAALLARKTVDLPRDAVLVHVPTASSRVRKRGYDHAALLTQSVAGMSGLRRARLLGRRGQTRQVGASRTQRIKQLEDAFRPLRPESVRGRHIILVDDVLTTGATLETAARTLWLYGAAHVDALVFAQA